jgi:hypothetical protein
LQPLAPGRILPAHDESSGSQQASACVIVKKFGIANVALQHVHGFVLTYGAHFYRRAAPQLESRCGGCGR